MTDQEKILKIMEEAKSPLKARAIAKLIYQNFDGYRLPGWAVRKILWDIKIVGLSFLFLFLKKHLKITKLMIHYF